AAARDDPGDGASDHVARTIIAIREMDPSIIVEVLVPDFHAQDWCIQIVLNAGPDIYNHNMETVERLTPMVRSRAKYRTSLRVLKRAKELSPKVVTKSGVMLGLGETEPELFQTMDDLREVGVQVLTMGQYLRPTPQHLPVVEYITPAQFEFSARLRAKKDSNTSPPARSYVVRITRPIFILSFASDGTRSFANRGGDSCISGRETRRRSSAAGAGAVGTRSRGR